MNRGDQSAPGQNPALYSIEPVHDGADRLRARLGLERQDERSTRPSHHFGNGTGLSESFCKIGEDVGALLRVRLAGIGHLGARHKGRRLGQERVEIGVAPVAALALHAVGIAEARDRNPSGGRRRRRAAARSSPRRPSRSYGRTWQTLVSASPFVGSALASSAGSGSSFGASALGGRLRRRSAARSRASPPFPGRRARC